MSGNTPPHPSAWLFLAALAFGVVTSRTAMSQENNEDRVVRMRLEGNTALDPYSYKTLPEWHIHENLTATLVEITEAKNEGEIRGVIAERWDIRDSGKTYEFHLSDKFRWSDGSPITAKQVATSIFRKSQHRSALYLPLILLPGPLERAVEVKNDRTLTVRLKGDFPGFLHLLARAEFGVLSEEGLAGKRMTTATPTSGPYKLGEISEERITLLRNQHYPHDLDSSESAPAKIVFSDIEEADLVDVVEKGELDFLEIVSENVLKAAESNPSYEVVAGAVANNLYTIQSRRADAKQRKLLAILAAYLANDAVDKLVEGKDKRQRATTMFFDSKARPFEPEKLDKQAAKAAVAECGHHVIRLQLGTDATDNQKEDLPILTEICKEIGIELEVQPQDGPNQLSDDYESNLVLMGTYAFNEVELYFGYFCSGYPPYRTLRNIVDEILNELSRPGVSDRETREGLRKLHRTLRDSGYLVPLYHLPRFYLVNRRLDHGGFRGVVPYPRFKRFEWRR
ncbi:MAG: ABC transporter substrate-binding protein [Planctomycetes bacterium]|nr:ABC transporter substrate-binding protein [Planctomycetota bacterium]